MRLFIYEFVIFSVPLRRGVPPILCLPPVNSAYDTSAKIALFYL